MKIARGENACCIEDRCVHLYLYSRMYGQLYVPTPCFVHRWMALDPDFDDFRFGDVKYDPADPQLQPGGSHPLPPLCTNGGVLNHATGVCEVSLF